MDSKVDGFFVSFLDGSVVVNKSLTLREKHMFLVHAVDKAKHISGWVRYVHRLIHWLIQSVMQYLCVVTCICWNSKSKFFLLRV